MLQRLGSSVGEGQAMTREGYLQGLEDEREALEFARRGLLSRLPDRRRPPALVKRLAEVQLRLTAVRAEIAHLR